MRDLNSNYDAAVNNNIFIGQTFGATFEGVTNVDLFFNDFFDNATVGATFLANGSYENNHNSNYFSNMYYGSIFMVHRVRLNLKSIASIFRPHLRRMEHI